MASKAERLAMDARSSWEISSLLPAGESDLEPGSDPDAQADNKRVTARSEKGKKRIDRSLGGSQNGRQGPSALNGDPILHNVDGIRTLMLRSISCR
jgi:hypothetical protein